MGLQSKQRGYSLLELLLFTGIFTIVLTAVYLMYWTNQTTFTRGKSAIDVHQHARVALETMAMEIRMAGYDPSFPAVIGTAGNATAVKAAAANQIDFIADVNGDNASDRVVYRLAGSQLIRDVYAYAGGGAWSAPTSSELADKLKTDDPVNNPGLSFTYLDSSGNPTATLANIRRITIRVTVEEEKARRKETFPLTIDVRLRNLS